jgi:hypothetical protein
MWLKSCVQRILMQSCGPNGLLTSLHRCGSAALLQLQLVVCVLAQARCSAILCCSPWLVSSKRSACG